MHRLIIAVLLLALILAPLETFGVLKRSGEQLKEVAGSSEARSLTVRFKDEFPKFADRVSQFFAKIFPDLEVGVKNVE